MTRSNAAFVTSVPLKTSISKQSSANNSSSAAGRAIKALKNRRSTLDNSDSLLCILILLTSKHALHNYLASATKEGECGGELAFLLRRALEIIARRY
jgi:hypothetical protein